MQVVPRLIREQARFLSARLPIFRGFRWGSFRRPSPNQPTGNFRHGPLEAFAKQIQERGEARAVSRPRRRRRSRTGKPTRRIEWT